MKKLLKVIVAAIMIVGMISIGLQTTSVQADFCDDIPPGIIPPEYCT